MSGSSAKTSKASSFTRMDHVRKAIETHGSELHKQGRLTASHIKLAKRHAWHLIKAYLAGIGKFHNEFHEWAISEGKRTIDELVEEFLLPLELCGVSSASAIQAVQGGVSLKEFEYDGGVQFLHGKSKRRLAASVVPPRVRSASRPIDDMDRDELIEHFSGRDRDQRERIKVLESRLRDTERRYSELSRQFRALRKIIDKVDRPAKHSI